MTPETPEAVTTEVRVPEVPMSVTFELAVVLVAVTVEPETAPVVKPAVKEPVKVPFAEVPAEPDDRLAKAAATSAAEVVAVEVNVKPLTVTV